MANIPVTQKDSIVDELEYQRYRIARRAYELFRSRLGWGDAMGDWLAAERELVWEPPIELREQDGALTVKAELPGIEPKDIRVDITSTEVVIQAATEHTHAEDKGHVHCCEFTSGQVFRSVSFPKAIDAKKAKAEYQNGVLSITAPMIAEAKSTRVEVKAA